MSLPTPWEPKNRPEQRVSHQEREQIAEVLRVAAGDGRLSLEELEERLEACFAARTYADLDGLVADLPGQAMARQQAQPKDVVHTKRIGGNVKYEGSWLVPKRLELEVRGGNVVLDFTRATVAEALTEVDARIRGGNLRLVVPNGYAVNTDEVELRGGSVRPRVEELPLEAVVHRIVVTGKIVGGNVTIRPPKEPREPGWLRRRLGGRR